MKNCISVDWLQLVVAVPCKDFDQKFVSGFKIERQKYQTRHFKSVYIISDLLGCEVATLAADPHAEILSFDSGLFKLNNRYLYRDDLHDFVTQILRMLKLTFRAISRIDIAVDFQTFDNGLNPHDFIKGFLSGKYVKQRKAKFKLAGEHGECNKFDYIKFGSETSDVSYYLYNKTRELEQVKMKGWIVDNWKANDWNEGDGDVWRLEFSLKKTRYGIVSGDGVFLSMDSMDFFKPEYLRDIFLSPFFEELFFYRNNGNTRKDRMPPLSLFDDLRVEPVKIKLSQKQESTRADKIFTKKLMQLNQEMRGYDFNLGVYNNELLTYYVKSRYLSAWCEKKLPQYCPSDRIASKFSGDLITLFSQLHRC